MVKSLAHAKDRFAEENSKGGYITNSEKYN